MTEDKEQTGNIVLSGASPIQVKFIGWLVIVCAGGFGGWIWWAASMSAKLDVVIAGQAAQTLSAKATSEDVTRLKEWRIQIDTVGSPALVRRVDSIDARLEELSKKFELHLATTTK
jgi:hypothetical protein